MKVELQYRKENKYIIYFSLLVIFLYLVTLIWYFTTGKLNEVNISGIILLGISIVLVVPKFAKNQFKRQPYIQKIAYKETALKLERHIAIKDLQNIIYKENSFHFEVNNKNIDFALGILRYNDIKRMKEAVIKIVKEKNINYIN